MTPPAVLAVMPSLTIAGGGIELHGRTLLARLARLRPAAGLAVATRHEVALAHPARVSAELATRLHWVGPARAGRLGFVERALFGGARLRPRVVLCGHLHHAPLALAVARVARSAKLAV